MKKRFVRNKNNILFGHIACYIVTCILQQAWTLKSPKARLHPLNDVRVNIILPWVSYMYMLRKRACYYVSYVSSEMYM